MVYFSFCVFFLYASIWPILLCMSARRNSNQPKTTYATTNFTRISILSSNFRKSIWHSLQTGWMHGCHFWTFLKCETIFIYITTCISIHNAWKVLRNGGKVQIQFEYSKIRKLSLLIWTTIPTCVVNLTRRALTSSHGNANWVAHCCYRRSANPK